MERKDDPLNAHPGLYLLVYFPCPNERCGCMFESQVHDATYDTRVEVSSDGTDIAETNVQCSECGDEFTVVVQSNAIGKTVTVKGHPDLHVDYTEAHFADQYDDFLAEYTPEDPYGIYNATVLRLQDLQHGLEVRSVVQPTFYKMVCLQHIIAFEAYLSDRLIDIVTGHKELMINLIGATPALRDLQPKLIEVAKDPEFVATATKGYLQRFSFHDLARVAQFYRAVLNVNLFKDEEHEQEMLLIIKMRHDLVHRSGRNSEGVDTLIEDSHVTILAEYMMDMVTRIEAAYIAFTANKSFHSSPA